MKKLILFTVLLFSFYSLNAQPIHECYSEIGTKIVLKGSDELICSLSTKFNLNDCFFISKSDIKDSLGITYFKFAIYKNIIDALDDRWKGKKMYSKDSVYTYKVRDVAKMIIYVGNVDRYLPTTFSLKISEFKKGSFFLDAKKNEDGLDGPPYDITPKEWSEIKKWKN